MAVNLSIIIPTYQERSNIPPLLESLETALTGVHWEVIFVDDNSPDGTGELIAEEGLKDPRIRCIKRLKRRGLSSACIEGILSSRAPFVAVMDADLQHDENLLPRMLEVTEKDGLDIVIGSRYISGGGTKEWPLARIAASALSGRLTQAVTGLTVKDPLSGFFLIRREFFLGCANQLSGKGFKILLDLLLSSSIPPRLQELPYTFRKRRHGKSKLTLNVILDYFRLILGKRPRRRSI